MLTLFRTLSRWPLWLLHVIGSLLGWLTYLASPTYRRRFRANAAQAGFTPAQTRGAIGAAGKMVAELPALWMRPAGAPVHPSPRWDGDELIENALRAGRGLVMLTPHMGAFEFAAAAVAERWIADGPLTVLFRPARKDVMREITERSRARAGLATAPATLAGVRQLIRALRTGHPIGLLPDQVPPEGMGAWAPFFGAPAYTMTLAARLVQQTGATLLLVWCERLPRGAGYTVHIRGLDEPLPSGENSQAESAAVINRAMEGLIRQCPAQYLWGYHRYKTPRSEA